MLTQAQNAKPAKILVPVVPAKQTQAIQKIEQQEKQASETKPELRTTSNNKKSPQELLHTALISVKFDRTPDGILNAIDTLSKKNKPQKDKARASAERLRLLANAGRWNELGQFIKKLPYKESSNKAYSHLIRSILKPPIINTSRTRSSNPTPISGLTTTPRTTTNKPRPILTQEDFVELLKIAPINISENDLFPNLFI